MSRHAEAHRTQRIGWLRAAVLGANDGIVSTASLLIGVAAAQVTYDQLVITGIASLVAGAMSMAAGEYVSVATQKDTQHADIAREREELASHPDREHEELAGIYARRGLDRTLAGEVAGQLMHKDALGAHMRDELGISETITVNPLQAALTSAASFAAGSALPVVAAVLSPTNLRVGVIAGSALVFLAILGAISARTGGAPVATAALRVTVWGVVAMGFTALVGSIFHLAVE
ncbi:MAG: VIT family protein [Proteobacteria bacterium]|nr:VIT family protein [Pseudomonadota bacterium]